MVSSGGKLIGCIVFSFLMVVDTMDMDGFYLLKKVPTFFYAVNFI
jgi:hypothetical protein